LAIPAVDDAKDINCLRFLARLDGRQLELPSNDN
jgi:hypothetical protein